MERKILLVVVFIGIFSLIECQSIRYSSDCTVPLCTSNKNSTCSDSVPCYSYQTSTNQRICAPRIDCSLFDACIGNGQCASNTSVCIVNTCCCQSICLPLAAIGSCANNNNSTITPNNSTLYSSSTSTTATPVTTTQTSSLGLSTTTTGWLNSTNAPGVLSVYGVQLNFNPASLPNGWSQCYSDTYNVSMNSTRLASILSVCNKGKLMLGCRPIGNTLLSVAAMGLRSDVLYNCSTSVSCTKVANGVGWYFSDNFSWGFVNNNDTVTRNQCDMDTNNSNMRLCWHTLSFGYAVGGYRCGANMALNYDGTYQRIIYQSD